MRKTSGNWGKIGREEKSGGRIREKMTKSGGKSGEFGRKGQNREVSRNSGESGNPEHGVIGDDISYFYFFGHPSGQIWPQCGQIWPNNTRFQTF